MKADERFSLEVFAVLNDIKTELLYSAIKTSDYFAYMIKDKHHYGDDGLIITEEDQKNILYKLEKMGAFKLETVDNPLTYYGTPIRGKAQIKRLPPFQFYLKINREKFDELYSQFSLEVDSIEPASVIPVKANSNDGQIKVRLIKDGLNLYLQSSDGQRIDLNRFRSDLPPAKIVDFLLARPNEVVRVSELKLEGEGFGATKNVAERLRKAGFTPTVKKYFLPLCDSIKVRLHDEAEMDSSELEVIKVELHSKSKSE